jgi:hypothetical protein
MNGVKNEIIGKRWEYEYEYDMSTLRDNSFLVVSACKGNKCSIPETITIRYHGFPIWLSELLLAKNIVQPFPDVGKNKKLSVDLELKYPSSPMKLEVGKDNKILKALGLEKNGINFEMTLPVHIGDTIEITPSGSFSATIADIETAIDIAGKFAMIKEDYRWFIHEAYIEPALKAKADILGVSKKIPIIHYPLWSQLA